MQQNILNFPYVRGGGGSGRIIFLMFSATHQNGSKAILSIFGHFYFFLPQNYFKDKKVGDFPFVRGGGGGVNQHMEISIGFLHLLFENFPYCVT